MNTMPRYCRFQNTISDFHDCVEHVQDTDLSYEERAARLNLVYDAIMMLEELGIEVDPGERSIEDYLSQGEKDESRDIRP